MLKDGQIWLNKTHVAKIEKNGHPFWKCLLFKKSRQNLKFVDMFEGDSDIIIDKLNEHALKITENKTITFA